ncbi:MAG: toxin-antitoxin system HicB family antitoxin [Flavobacteriaceae bacterium]|nr:toxin-antitoxin system HicB family antitoxin [Flavobacteriaceae bacterium]
MKVQTALRFDEELLKMIKAKAKAQRRSLNNYIENLLYQEVGNIPNEETIEAINEAINSNDLIPIEDLDKFLEEL